MSRMMPTECHHGNVIDWGDFGPHPAGCPGMEPYTADPECPECYPVCPECATDRGEGDRRLLQDAASPGQPAEADDPSPHRDPASSAPLSELVAVNVAGDIEAVADDIDGLSCYAWGCVCEMDTEDAVARLRRIAAGIREAD